MKTMKFFLMILLFFMMLYENGNTQWLLKINGLKTDYHYSPAVAAYEDKTALVGFFQLQRITYIKQQMEEISGLNSRGNMEVQFLYQF